MFYAFAPANETMAFMATLVIAAVMFVIAAVAFLALLGIAGAIRLLVVLVAAVGGAVRRRAAVDKRSAADHSYPQGQTGRFREAGIVEDPAFAARTG